MPLQTCQLEGLPASSKESITPSVIAQLRAIAAECERCVAQLEEETDVRRQSEGAPRLTWTGLPCVHPGACCFRHILLYAPLWESLDRVIAVMPNSFHTHTADTMWMMRPCGTNISIAKSSFGRSYEVLLL